FRSRRPGIVRARLAGTAGGISSGIAGPRLIPGTAGVGVGVLHPIGVVGVDDLASLAVDGALLGACRRHIGGVEILAVLGHRAAHALPFQVQIAVSADADLGTVGAGQVIVAGELPVGVQNRVVHAHPDHGVGALLQGVA